jgi:hypothetical protein
VNRIVNGNRLAGHGLRHEGKTRDVFGSWASNAAGPGRCSCGMWSPNLPNTAKRKQWHRDHKADLRAGGDGRVWEGVE